MCADTIPTVPWNPRVPFVRRREAAWRRRAHEPGELLYVALGDSAALGVGTADLDASYVGLIAHRLQRLAYQRVRVVNLGRYGARVHGVLDRQLDALAGAERTWGRPADLVTLAIGGNDAVRAAGLALAPLHRVTEFRRGWGSFPDFGWDQFHPSRRGYRVWESAFARAVSRRARELRPDVGGAA